MDDRNELNDIMINESRERLASSKKILIFGAGGTVLFLVTIFVVYILSRGGDSKPQTPTKQTQAELAQSSPKPLEVQNLPSEQLPKEPLFEEINIKEEPKTTPDKIEKALQEIKERNKQEASAKSSAQVAVVKEQPKQEQPKAEEKKPQDTKAPKDIKQEFESVSTQKTETTEVPKGLYVQVGAFFKFTPDRKFIEAIKNNNYQYQLLKTKSGGNDVTKVLIGPFMDDAEAKKALQKIREQINDRAFIVKG